MVLPMMDLVSILVFATAGFGLFLMLLNRRLFLIPDCRLKRPVMVLSFVVITGGSALLGFVLPSRPCFFIPVGVLCLIVVGEVRRVFIRRKCAGSSPVDAKPHQLDITRPFTTNDLACYRYQVSFHDWRGSAFRIVLLSDFHVDGSFAPEFYRHVFSVAEQSCPDLVFMVGDFITKLESLPALSELLRPIGKLGTFAVLGNHDYWTDAEKVGAVVSDCGIRLLTNESVGIELAGAAVRLTGTDYPWKRGEKTIAASLPGELHLVLSHTPDNIYRISKSGADCVFSGHCHAGQIRLPFAGSIVVPSVYGRRFDHGHFIVNGTHLFVAGGIGTTVLPVRIYCRPDIFIIDISGQPEKESPDNN